MTLHYNRSGSPIAGSATDEAGRPTYWSRLTQGRRVRVPTMQEARRRAAADAQTITGQPVEPEGDPNA